MTTFYEVTRDVAATEEHNHLGRDVKAGEKFEAAPGATWGCIDKQHGIALWNPDAGTGVFFEFPADAVRRQDPRERVTQDGGATVWGVLYAHAGHNLIAAHDYRVPAGHVQGANHIGIYCRTCKRKVWDEELAPSPGKAARS